jgi:hypothetical protein
MIDLNSLLEGEASGLDDLVTVESPTDRPLTNPPTASNMAAHTALLVGEEEAFPTYQTIVDELGANTLSSRTMDEILLQANQRENNISNEAFVEILSDETIPLSKRIELTNQWQVGDVSLERERSPEELLQINSLGKDGKTEGNEEVNITRWDIAKDLQEVNKYNNYVQGMINEAEKLENPTAFQTVRNFTESILPFLESATVAETQIALKKYQDSSTPDTALAVLKAIGLMGESKEEIRSLIARTPIEGRYKMASAVYDMVLATGGTVAGDRNMMIMMDSLRSYLVEGEYGVADRVIDDVSSLLDVVGLGSTIRGAKAGLKSVANSTRFTRRSPKSVASSLGEVNDKSFTDILKAAVDDETGQVAEATFGSSRSDAMVNSVGPEIALPDGTIRHKPLIDDPDFAPDSGIINHITHGKGNIQFSEAEKASKLDAVKADIGRMDVTGIHARKEMTTIEAVDDGVKIRTVIGPAEGGFSNPVHALDQAKLALRKYGVNDQELALLKRQPNGTYKPVALHEVYRPPHAEGKGVLKAGNYLVGVNHTSKYDPTDFTTKLLEWGETTVKGVWNAFDKFPVMIKGKGGSITQHAIPSSVYVDPRLTNAATVASDQSMYARDILAQKADDYASKFLKLDSTDKGKFDAYVVKANQDSLKFDPLGLRARGYSDDLIETIRDWKSTQDTIYVLENVDKARQARRKGFQLYVGRGVDDEFMARPLTPQAAGKVDKVYDPETGTIRSIGKDERDKLYGDGGQLAQTRTPVSINGETIGHMIVKNTDKGYLRAIRDTDKVLNYRDGHFTIYYKDPVFITQTVKNADGTTYEKAVATAGSTSDADRYIDDLRKADPEGQYDRRGDLKGEDLDEMMWNSYVNAGRTAQRTRGKTLADSSSRPTDLDFRHVDSPEESLMRSIESIAARIDMREFLDTAKKRFEEQYKDFLPEHPENHSRMWPRSVKDIKKPTGQNADMGAYHDAISTYRYIDQMENGFINLLDDMSKNFFKAMSETGGRKGWDWLEKGADKASEANPTGWARKKAFRLMLAANPLRQFPVQASAAIPVITATNPRFWIKAPGQLTFLNFLDRGGDAATISKGLGEKIAGLSVEEAIALQKAYEQSGIKSAVNAHSVIRDDIKSLVNRGPVKKTLAVIGKPLDIAQKVGFQAGENLLMKSVWLSEYDVLRRSGKTIDSAALANLHARVRNLTLNMNKAGELAYNENALSVAMQFLQAPHKAFAQIVMGHRGLTKADRLKLGTAYTLTYGVGYGWVADQAAQIIDPSDRHLLEIVTGGLFNLGMNKALSTIYGEDVNVDFSSSMRLLEIPNIINMAEAMSTMDLETILTKSPSIAMAYGDNGKFGELVRSIGRLYTVPEDDGAYKDVAMNAMNMFSGMSNFFKYRYIMENGHSISGRGEEIDEDVNSMEALMRLGGFATVDEMLQYSSNEKTYFQSKGFKDDVKKLLSETSRRLAREGISEKEMDYVIRMYQEANRVWGSNPYAMEYLGSQIGMQAKTGAFVLFNRLVEMGKTATEAEMRAAIASSNLSSEDRQKLMTIIDFMKGRD